MIEKESTNPFVLIMGEFFHGGGEELKLSPKKIFSKQKKSMEKRLKIWTQKLRSSALENL